LTAGLAKLLLSRDLEASANIATTNEGLLASVFNILESLLCKIGSPRLGLGFGTSRRLGETGSVGG
jgi:hypothetical protein